MLILWRAKNNSQVIVRRLMFLPFTVLAAYLISVPKEIIVIPSMLDIDVSSTTS